MQNPEDPSPGRSCVQEGLPTSACASADVCPRAEVLRTWAAHASMSWPDEVIKDFADVLPFYAGANNIIPFLKECVRSVGPIDMRTVVGQWQQNAGYTWRVALLDNRFCRSRLERVMCEYDRNPSYYFTTDGEDKDDMGFSSVDGQKWYSHDGGGHRTIVAKFLHSYAREKTGEFVLLSPVRLCRYTVDFDLHALNRRIQELIVAQALPLDVSPRSRKLETQRSDCDQFETEVYVRDRRFAGQERSIRLSADDFTKYADWLLSSQGDIKGRHWFQYLFGKVMMRKLPL